jgi:hypothetical protein
MLPASSWTGPLLVFGLCTANSVDVRERPADLIRCIDEAESSREARLAGYTVAEYYTIRNSHFTRPAEARVEAKYRRGEGTTFRVQSQSGPSLLNRALDRLLQEESQMSRGRAREQAIITSANYEMKPIGRELVNGTMCAVLELTPRRKSPYLLKGRLWVNAADVKVVKVEGRPPTSASFFAGRPQIVRQYKQIDGFALAELSHAVSRSFLFGQSTVDIEYRDYHLVTSSRSTR